MAEKAYAEEPRSPIERLRRFRLWQIADAYGIQYPKDAAKETMVKILEGNGVDVTRPLPDGQQLPWKNVPVQQADGTMTTQLYPVEPEKGALDNATLARILEEREQQRKQAEETEGVNDQLRGQIEQLTEMNERLMARLDALESRSTPAPEPPVETVTDPAPGKTGLARYHAIRRACKEQGITVRRGDRVEDMERKLNGHAS